MKTYSTKKADIERQWHVIDASDQVLGRLAAKVASLLMGKHKPIFSPNLDVGDYVVVINADKFSVTGKKLQQKVYYHHTGYLGELKSTTLGKMLQEHPTRAFERAVKGMLPHTRLGARMLKRLRVYAGEVHPHLSQLKAASAEPAAKEKG